MNQQQMYPPVDVLHIAGLYAQHVNAMTVEGLHDKADIAAQLAIRDNTIAELQGKNSRLRESVAALESLRPHWAKGYSNDSLAAQAATTALAQLWGVLGVRNQTEAMQRLHTLADRRIPVSEKIELLRCLESGG